VKGDPGSEEVARCNAGMDGGGACSEIALWANVAHARRNDKDLPLVRHLASPGAQSKEKTTE